MNFWKVFFSFSLILFLLSCNPSQKLSGANRDKIKGSWVLSNIEYSNTKDKFKSVLFGEGDMECFIGSQWNFIENNNSGTYTLVPKANCNGVTRQIKWDVVEEGGIQYFQFKRMVADTKAKNISAGYRLQLATVMENSIQMIQPTNVNGESLNLIYTFVKNNIKK